MKTFDFANYLNIPMRTVLKCKGDCWGHNDCFEHLGEIPSIEFYDKRHEHTVHGQYIGSYFMTTFLSSDNGIDLHGGVGGWKINKEDKRRITDWIESIELDAYRMSTSKGKKDCHVNANT